MDASTLSREQEALVNAGDLALAEQVLEAWLRDHDGEDSFVPRLELARVRFWRGRPRQARELLERLLRERPGDTWTASFLAQVEIALGDHERARELLERALAFDPSNHEARLFLGGDVHDDVLQVRRRLTHGAPSPRARIELGALCSAIDFRRGLSRPRDPEEAAIAAEDLRRRRERTVAVTNAGPHVSRALLEVARDHAHVGAVLDVHIDRHARGLDPWQSTRPPYRHLLAYPARLHRMMEMALGIKLLDDPAAARVTLSLSGALSRIRAEALARHGIEGAEYHCVIESAS